MGCTGEVILSIHSFVLEIQHEVSQLGFYTTEFLRLLHS